MELGHGPFHSGVAVPLRTGICMAVCYQWEQCFKMETKTLRLPHDGSAIQWFRQRAEDYLESATHLQQDFSRPCVWSDEPCNLSRGDFCENKHLTLLRKWEGLPAT